jgi:protein dithiol oxidoreductase (disulfide-forming)
VFWYGCGHCYDFEPMFDAWAETLPDDVAIVRSPAMWDQQGIMERHARIYFTAIALGVFDKLHMATFEAMNLHRNQLETEASIAKLFEDNGVSREDFDKTFNSFGVTSAVKQAESRLRGYRTQGTPEIVVNGTYRVSSRMTGGHQGMLNVTSFLVDKIRSEK